MTLGPGKFEELKDIYVDLSDEEQAAVYESLSTKQATQINQIKRQWTIKNVYQADPDTGRIPDDIYYDLYDRWDELSTSDQDVVRRQSKLREIAAQPEATFEGQPVSEVGSLGAAGEAVQSAFQRTLRGIDPTMEPERAAEQQRVADERMGPLEEHYPISTGIADFVGGSGPQLLAEGLATATPWGRTAMTALRGLPAMGVSGGVDALVEARGRGQDPTMPVVMGAGLGIAGGEIFNQVIKFRSSVADDLVTRITGKENTRELLNKKGEPTEYLQKILDDNNLSFDELSESSKAYFNDWRMMTEEEGVAESFVVRDLMKSEMGADFPTPMPFTTGDPADLVNYQRLGRTPIPESAPIRETNIEISERLQPGELYDSGEVVKKATDDLLKFRYKEKNEAYEALKLYDFDATRYPLDKAPFDRGMTSDTLDNMSKGLSPEEADDVNDLLVQYGLNINPDAVKAFEREQIGLAKKGNPLRRPQEITQLNLLTYGNLRESLNSLQSSQGGEAIDNVVNYWRNIIDGEVDRLGKEIKKIPDELLEKGASQGEIDDAVAFVGAYNNARSKAKEYYEVNDIGSLSQAILNKKGRGEYRMTEASAIVDKVLGKGPMGAPERLDIFLQQLRRDGGGEAIDALQDDVMLRLGNAAFNHTETIIAEGRKTAARYNPEGFEKEWRKIGDRKLQLIFQDSPEKWRYLNRQRTINHQFLRGGSTLGDVPQDFIEGMSQWPVFRYMLGGAAGASTGSLILGLPIAAIALSLLKFTQGRITRMEVKKLTSENPTVRNRMAQLRYLYPQLAVALGLDSAVERPDSELSVYDKQLESAKQQALGAE